MSRKIMDANLNDLNELDTIRMLKSISENRTTIDMKDLLKLFEELDMLRGCQIEYMCKMSQRIEIDPLSWNRIERFESILSDGIRTRLNGRVLVEKFDKWRASKDPYDSSMRGILYQYKKIVEENVIEHDKSYLRKKWQKVFADRLRANEKDGDDDMVEEDEESFSSLGEFDDAVNEFKREHRFNLIQMERFDAVWEEFAQAIGLEHIRASLGHAIKLNRVKREHHASMDHYAKEMAQLRVEMSQLRDTMKEVLSKNKNNDDDGSVPTAATRTPRKSSDQSIDSLRVVSFKETNVSIVPKATSSFKSDLSPSSVFDANVPNASSSKPKDLNQLSTIFNSSSDAFSSVSSGFGTSYFNRSNYSTGFSMTPSSTTSTSRSSNSNKSTSYNNKYKSDSLFNSTHSSSTFNYSSTNLCMIFYFSYSFLYFYEKKFFLLIAKKTFSTIFIPDRPKSFGKNSK